MNKVPTAVRPVLLILEDDADTALSLTDLVAARLPDVEVVAKSDATSAHAMVQGSRIDLLIVDYRLPGTNGVEFLEEVQRLKPDLPSILITAHRNPEMLAEAVNRGQVQGILLKPVEAAGFVAAVKKLLRKRMGSRGRIPPQ